MGDKIKDSRMAP